MFWLSLWTVLSIYASCNVYVTFVGMIISSPINVWHLCTFVCLAIALHWSETPCSLLTISPAYLLQVYSIRDAAANNLKRLAEEFGPEWAMQHIIPQVCPMILTINCCRLPDRPFYFFKWNTNKELLDPVWDCSWNAISSLFHEFRQKWYLVNFLRVVYKFFHFDRSF